MPKRSRDQLGEEEDGSIPLSIQTFLWRQTVPFLRPRLNRQQDPQISVEQREACKSYEKVLVQNICFSLSSNLTEAIKKISRWKLIQSALPHVVHCCSTLLYRKNLYQDKLNASDTKLLYTLHWIILDASEECIDAELEQNIIKPPEHYLLPVCTIEVFIFQFAPLISYLKNSDFLTNFRLENGFKLWGPLFVHEHPAIPSFTNQVKPKKSIFTSSRCERSQAVKKFDDIFLGDAEDKPTNKQTPETSKSTTDQNKDDPDAINITITTTTTISVTTTTSVASTTTASTSKPKMTKEEEAKANILKTKKDSQSYKLPDPSMATFLDVAVLRCLFASQWLEEGILWSLIFLEKRLKSIREDMKVKSIRPRSSSLPYNKLTSMMYSVADNIQQRKVTKLSKKECEAEQKTTTQQTDTNVQQQTRSTLNASLIDTSLRRNSYTPSNVSADPETKSIKFKKQRTEEQLLNNASGSCTNCAISGKDEQQSAGSGTNQSFLANLRSDIQKFGQKRKPKSNALSTVKKDHQKNRPIRCSSCDILDANNPKLSKQSSIQSNSRGQSSSNNVQVQSSTTTTSSVQASVTNSSILISATCSQVSISTTTQTRSSPIKTLSNLTQQTSNKPLEFGDNSKLVSEQQSTQFTEGDLSSNQTSQLLKFKNELINSNADNLTRKTSSQEDLSVSTMSQQHQPAEKRDSNKSSSSTDTTVGSNTNSISVSTTTAATISGSLGKGIIAPFQIDTSNKPDETDDALNPIITITEHSPISSSTNQFFIGSSGQQQQQSDDQQTRINQDSNIKDKSIKRSLTDTNVCYFRPKETEALGTLNYITKSGQICLLVILKAVHNVSVRENVCTPRVCDGIVNILNELVSLGLLEHIKELERSSSSNSNLEKSKLKYLRARSSDEYSVLQLFLDTCMNIFKMIGCEHGCNKQVKPADVTKTRQELFALLFKLFDASQTQFLSYFQELIHLKQLNELIDIFHSYLGFCTERNQSTNISRESSRKPGACNKISSGSSNKLSPTINNQSSSSSCSPSKPTNENLAGSSNDLAAAAAAATMSTPATLTTTINSNVNNNMNTHTSTSNQTGLNITTTITTAGVTQSTLNENQKNHNNNQSINETIITNDPKITLTPTSPKPPLSSSKKDLKKDKEQLIIKQRNFKIEEFIIKSTFSPLIDRLTRVSRALNHNENLSTYCDIRQMLIFIKTYHSSTFRKTTLSALVECTEQMKRKQQAERMIQQQQQQKQKEQSNNNKEDNESSGNVNFYINDEPQPSTSASKQQSNEKQNRKSFFKRRNQKASSSQSITGEDSGNELQQFIGASETELPLIQTTANKDDQLKNFPSSASFTNANLAIKPTKQNAYLLGMLKSKGEETYYKGSSSNFAYNQLSENAQSLHQSSTPNFLTDQSLSSIQLKSNRGYWFGGRNQDQNNNNQDKQMNSDGVFVFSANNQPKDETKIFTVGGAIGSAAAASLYSGNTLAVAPIAEIRRSSFQSRTYLGKHLGFANDFNGPKSIHKARKAVEDQFLKIHLMSKRPGGPKIANGNLTASEDQTTNLMPVGQTQQQQPEISRKSSLNYLDMQNAEKVPYHQPIKHQTDQINSKEMDIISLKEGKILTLSVLKNGVLKFSFLLESCPPGSLPDSALIAAVLGLKAPVIARASFFFELANFVHNCNYGNWPKWMRTNFPILRNSGPLNKPFCRPNPRSLGQNSNLQRYAGRIFYHWAEAIASFLEELLIKEKLELEKQEQLETISILNENDENDTDDAKSLKLKRIKYGTDDEEEDFLEDKTVNPNGNDCPYALKFAAVSCLTEITQYLRETHQTLKPEKIEKPPKKNLLNLSSAQSTGATTTVAQTTTHSTGAKGFASLAKQILERHDQDKDTKPSAPPAEPEKKKPLMTASRRWSMALSNLGLSQVTVRGLKNREDASHSLKESTKKQQEQHAQDQHSKESSSHSGTHSSGGERRISFVIHEAEGENNSEHSSNTTLTQQEADQGASSQQAHQQPVKRLSQSSSTLTGASRPNLLNRRGTGTQSISGSSGQQANQQQQSTTQSSGQPTINLQNGGTSGSFKRRSIRLKKDSKSKRTSTLAEDQEDSGEYNGMKRTDSLRSRRKVSGISERSDTSDRAGDLSGDESVGILSDDGQIQQQQAHQMSHDNTFFMTYGKFTHFNILEQDDQRLCSNMPWLKVVNQLLLSLDYNCKHINGCSKFCYRRQMRSCSKLIKTVSKIYKQNLRSKDPYYHTTLNKNHEDGSKVMQPLNAGSMPHPSGSAAFISGNPLDLQKQREKKSKSIYGSGSPIRRKVSMSQHHDRMIDRDSGHLSLSVHGSSSFLPHLEIDAGSSSGTIYGCSSSAIQPSNFNQLSTSQSDPQKSFIEANRQRLFQKYCMKSKYRSLTVENQISSEEEFLENIAQFVENSIRNLFHTPISLLLKGFLVLPDTIYSKLLYTSWNLILESDQHLSCTAACAFLLCSYKCSEQATELLNSNLNSSKADEQIAAMRKFHIIWKFRYQCWPRMEENACNKLKLPPPTIEFTLPSPKIALSSMPVANPPWMPQSKYKVEEVALNQEQSLQKSFVTATKTRRKQQIEMIHKALADQQEKQKEERESYVISSVAIANEASYEPALHKSDEHEEDPEDVGLADRLPTHHLQVAQPIFTSALCSASLTIINLLNDSQVNDNGCAVYELAYKVIWYCLVEDSALFLRNLFERLTKENGKYILQILRRIIRFMPRLPSSAGFSLYNYLIGYIMYHVRSPTEYSQELIGTTLSVLWLVVPSVHGLFLKSLKQVLRKEQCDHSVLITANVPSTKKIIVHTEDSVGIPSQFNVQEDTQFAQILSESLEYFSIDEKLVNEYYLLDSKSNQIHNLGAFVRDFYFFKRSQYPQLTLTHMNAEKAAELLQKQALTLQFTELGKVLMSLSIVNTPNLAIQRVLFLHEELMKLPAFPRKALESNFQLHHGSVYGRALNGMDTLHKLVWVKLVARMLEITSGFFAHSSDIHLFLNVVNGALILHCEDSSVLRLSMATFINAAHQFKNIFNVNGYLLILPTILRIYSQHQTNALLCKTVEFVCKQFYIMHRKPFLLQMFGSASTILDIDGQSLGDATKVQPKAFFKLLQSMSSYSNEPMQILDLVQAEKPLRALDFCYQMDTENITILDTISICVCVIGYAADSQRAIQMLTILEAILPLYLRHIQSCTLKKSQTPRDELTAIHNISVCIKTLISNCEGLTRNFTGPQRAIDLRSSSIKNASKGAYGGSPMEVDDDSHSNPTNGPTAPQNLGARDKAGAANYAQYTFGSASNEDNELLRAQFRQPRDVLLNLVCEYLTKSTARLAELSKKIPDLHPSKNSSHELLDVKCHLRLAEIAHSLLKVAPYDPSTMQSKGLIRYMNEILPTSDWRQEHLRPALIIILRRLDKMFNKIAKKGQIRRWTDWDSAKKLLKGIYSTFLKHPYIVHLPHLKSLISVCQYIVLGDNATSSNMLSSGNTNVLSGVGLTSNNGANQGANAGVIGGIGNLAQASSNTAGLTSLLTPDISNQLTNVNSWTTALAQSPPPGFVSVVVRLIALQLLQLNENQTLETVCSGIFSNNTEKTEIYLMNMIYPMCIRISGSIRDVPKLRTCDITLILSAILSTLNSQSKVGYQSVGINRTISPNTLHQIGFLGLKIMIACFERQLSNDWHRIARCIRELTKNTKSNCLGTTYWKFFDFVVTYRTPLFILLLPLIKFRLLTRYCDNDEEYYYQQQISEKLQGRCFYDRNLSKGNLYKSLFNELNNLKNNLVTKRFDDNRKPTVMPTNAANLTASNLGSNLGNTGNHRLSFAIMQPKSSQSILPTAPNLPQSPDEEQRAGLTMDASNNSSINILSNASTPNKMKSLLNRGFSIRSSISSSSGDTTRTPRKGGLSFTEKARGLSVRLPPKSAGGGANQSTSANLVDKFLRRTSYPYNTEDQIVSSSPPGKPPSTGDSSGTISSVPNTGNELKGANESKIFTFDNLKEIDSINSVNVSGTEGSFDESSEPRLHRQKAQSKKMFKNRKSKKGKKDAEIGSEMTSESSTGKIEE